MTLPTIDSYGRLAITAALASIAKTKREENNQHNQQLVLSVCTDGKDVFAEECEGHFVSGELGGEDDALATETGHLPAVGPALLHHNGNLAHKRE
jgi:hypothetical protein